MCRGGGGLESFKIITIKCTDGIYNSAKNYTKMPTNSVLMF